MQGNQTWLSHVCDLSTEQAEARESEFKVVLSTHENLSQTKQNNSARAVEMAQLRKQLPPNPEGLRVKSTTHIKNRTYCQVLEISVLGRQRSVASQLA